MRHCHMARVWNGVDAIPQFVFVEVVSYEVFETQSNNYSRIVCLGVFFHEDAPMCLWQCVVAMSCTVGQDTSSGDMCWNCNACAALDRACVACELEAVTGSACAFNNLLSVLRYDRRFDGPPPRQLFG